MRTPNPTILRYRVHINIAAMALISLGLLTAFDARYHNAGAVLLFGTFLAWIHLRGRIRPLVSDYTEYLEILAKEEGHGDWLRSANQRFMTLWDIEDLKEVDQGV